MSNKKKSERNGSGITTSESNDASPQSPRPTRLDVSTPMRPSILTPSTPKSEFHHFAENILSPLGLFSTLTPAGESRQPNIPTSKDWSPMASFSNLSNGDFFYDFLDSPVRDPSRASNGGMDTPIGSSEAALQQNRSALQDRVSGSSSSGVAGFPELRTNTGKKHSKNSGDIPPTHKKARKSAIPDDAAPDTTQKRKRSKLQQLPESTVEPKPIPANTSDSSAEAEGSSVHTTPPSSSVASVGLLSSSLLTHNASAIGSPQSFMIDLSAPGPPSMSPALTRNNVTCNCKKSKCLKLYCDCFRAQQYCFGCHCSQCNNVKQHESERRAAVAQIMDRNPDAFKPRIATDQGGNIQQHQSGCHCKKSACLKKYCECFQAAVPCQERCRCIDCKNTVAHMNPLASSGSSVGATPNGASPAASWSPTPTKEFFRQKNIALDKDAENAAIEFVSALLRGHIPPKTGASPVSSSAAAAPRSST